MAPLIFATVHKNGSSLAVVIPKDICRAFDIKRGDQLMVNATQGGIVQLRRVSDKAREKIIKY